MHRHRALSTVATQAALVAFPFLSPFVAGPSVNVWQLLGAWVCVAALVLLAGRSHRGVPARALLCWLGVALAAIAWRHGRDPALCLGAMGAVVAVGLAACVGAGWARAPRTRPAALAWGLLAAGLVSAVLGLCQYYGAASALVPWTTAPEVGQAYGNLRQRNQFATLVAMALAAALWLHAERASRAAPGRAAAGAATTAAIALLMLAAAASTSRTGLLQWVSISLAAAALAWGERRTRGRSRSHRLPHPVMLLALIPAYFAAAWALPLAAGPEVEGMLRRLRDGLPEGHGRMLLWRNVVDLVALHPWAGWGWGELSFAHFDTLYAGPRFVEILDNAHNLPLHLAVELGVPMSLAICGGFAALALAARPWREREPTRLLAWAALGAMVLHSLLEYPLWYGPFQLVFGLCLGLLWPGAAAAAGDAHEDQDAMVAAPAAGAAPRPVPTPAPAWMRLPRAVAVLLLAAVAYAAWDYTRISQLYLARADRLAPWRDDTLAKLRSSWLFASQVRFAELSMTPVTSANAADVHALAQRMLHFSPEPRVIARLIDSAMLLGRDDEAAALAARFKVAFPAEYARWKR